MTFNIIIFSRNRPIQLELLLRSIRDNFVNYDNHEIKILYLYDNEEYKKGYHMLFEMYPEFTYIKQEKSFPQHLNEMFDTSKKYTMFGVDDDVFKERFDADSNEFGIFVANSNIVSLSLRLHPNINYCYPMQIDTPPPSYDRFNVFKWVGEQGDHGYPMSLDFNIFRTNDILYYIFNSKLYDNPNSLESMMAMRPLEKPYMICFNKSPVVNIPLNRVQTFNNNIHGNICVDYLNKMFLNGYIISTSNIYGINNKACHQLIDIKFEKR
jgi:hypothetical protein